MKIKKTFAPIVEFLNERTDELVSDVMPQLIELIQSQKSTGGTATKSHRDDDGNVDAIFCWYHKLWMSPKIAEFGSKASSPTGLNSMCKDGVSKWTKQQRDYKRDQPLLLVKVVDGELEIGDIKEAMADLEEIRDTIVPREDDYGFEDLDECIAHALTKDEVEEIEIEEEVISDNEE